MVEPVAMGATTDDEDLVARCRSGERAAFDELVARYAPRVGRVIGALVDDRDAVDDLVQETFVRAFCGLNGYRPGCFEAWLKRIAINTARMYRRSAWQRLVDLVSPPDMVVAADDEPYEQYTRRETARRLREAVSRLPARQAQAVRLRYLAGESFPAMTELLGVPESTLRSRVEAGLDRLRAVLDEEVGR